MKYKKNQFFTLAAMSFCIVTFFNQVSADTGSYVRHTSWGTGTPSGVISRTATRASAPDPVGDTFGVQTPQLDITEFSVSYSATSVLVDMSFDGPIAPADAALPESIYGFIEFDLDQNPGTGLSAFSDIFCPQASGIGVETIVELGSVNSVAGTVDVLTNFVSHTGDISFGPQSLSIQIPLSALDGDDGLLDAISVIGTFPEPTDCVPNSGFLTSSPSAAVTPAIPVPTLNVYALLLMSTLLGLVGLVSSFGRRR